MLPGQTILGSQSALRKDIKAGTQEVLKHFGM